MNNIYLNQCLFRSLFDYLCCPKNLSYSHFLYRRLYRHSKFCLPQIWSFLSPSHPPLDPRRLFPGFSLVPASLRVCPTHHQLSLFLKYITIVNRLSKICWYRYASKSSTPNNKWLWFETEKFFQSRTTMIFKTILISQIVHTEHKCFQSERSWKQDSCVYWILKLSFNHDQIFI